MKAIYNISAKITGILAIVIFASCEEKITYDVGSEVESRVVIEGRITNEKKEHILRITNTDSYFSNQPPSAALVEDIEIHELGSQKVYTVSKVDTGVGNFITEEFAGLIGEEYQLSLRFRNETYQAIVELDSVAEMDSVKTEYEYNTFFEGGFYKIQMYAFEPDPVGHYYRVNLYVNDSLYNTRLDLTTFFDDEIINGKYFEGVDMYWLPQEEISLDTNMVRLEMLSISRDEYNYNNALLAETVAQGNIFSGPPADVPSNLKSIDSDKTGLGFFAASATTSVEGVLYKVHDESTNNPDYKK